MGFSEGKTKKTSIKKSNKKQKQKNYEIKKNMTNYFALSSIIA